MLLLLHDFGFPHGHGQSFVFNGDWVDRGKHQLEVVCLVFAYKIAYPHNVKLVRGNHEDKNQNIHTGKKGFQFACIDKFGEELGKQVFEAFAAAFDWLPLGCLVGERILVVHGGIGDGNWTLDHIREAERPLTMAQLAKDPVLYNILWSDPVPETVDNSFGVHSSPRDNHAKLIHQFGPDCTEKFLETNGLAMLIRSHQARQQGTGYEVMHKGRCVRVFSARDYEGHANDASVLSVRSRYPIGGPLLVRAQVLRSIRKKDDIPNDGFKCCSVPDDSDSDLVYVEDGSEDEPVGLAS